MSYHTYRTMLRRRWFIVTAFLILLAFCLGWGLSVAQAQQLAWPSFTAHWKFKLVKLAGAEMTDPFWMHLHAGAPGFDAFTIGPEVTPTSPTPVDPMTVPPGNQLRYTVHGVPVSRWLDAPWQFEVRVDNPALDALLDGIHDISFEVQGPLRADIRPLPAYVHLARGRAVDPTVPILAHNATTNYDDYDPYTSQGPGVVYVNRADRKPVGYPADPAVVPWHTPPSQADLYQEQMAPHSDLFMPVQLWWEEPAVTVSAGMSFIRGMGSKFGTEHAASLYDATYGGLPIRSDVFGFTGHRNFPFRDGPRGIGWASPFITGQVDRHGGLAFVESGGPLRYMQPDGELITVAGWRVMAGHDPVWIQKPLNQIRANMELRGTWLSGERTDLADRGFHYATDVAIDPRDENVWYIAGFGDNIIWKVLVDRATWLGTVSVFAGSLTHQPGYGDGQGTTARFNGPSSIVFDPICDCLYVADQKNNAVRTITRGGLVTTLVGSPGMGARLAARGLPVGVDDCWPDPSPMTCYNEPVNRTVSKIDVTATEAAAGIRPEVYSPMTVRVDSKGNLILLDVGLALISRINPRTFETKKLGEVEGRWQRFAPGWLWMDVDRWGNSGPLDSIYWVQGVSGGQVDGEDPGDRHINETLAWLPADGGLSTWVSGPDWALYPNGWGKLAETDIPHYPWMIAIDPRGALYLSGMGEHGITRIRTRRPEDPVPGNYFRHYDGDRLWLTGEQPGGHSFSFKYGYDGHNYLGFADTWGLKPGVTDAELITTFEVPQSIQATPGRLATLLNFIRANAGHQLGTPLPTPVDTTAPTMPQQVTVSVLTSTGLILSWQGSSDDVGVTSYRLTRNGVVLPQTTQTTQTETGLTPNTAYTYIVQAQDAAGNVSPGGLVMAVTLPALVPVPRQVVQTWKRRTWAMSCIASGLERTKALTIVEMCVNQLP